MILTNDKSILRFVIFVVLGMVLGSTLISQSQLTYQFDIQKNSRCSQEIERFKTQHHILVAYNPQLSHKVSHSRRIESHTIDSLFYKLCAVFQLEFTNGSEKNSFLVRSQPKDIEHPDFIIQHIRLKDMTDGSPISDAIVYDQSKKYYGFTDQSGDCFIKMPKNQSVASLRTHALGHQDVEILLNDDTFNEVALAYDPVMASAVTIENLKKSLVLAGKDGHVDLESKAMMQLGEASVFHRDVMRLLQLLPGVSAINDMSSGLRIRGSNEEVTLMVLDEMPIYRADHFYGIFSAINGQYVRKMELYKNNIPVTYGGRTSGLLKMSSDSKNDSLNLNVDIQLLQSGLNANIPLGKFQSIGLAARKSYSQLTKSNYFNLANNDNSVFTDLLLTEGSTATSSPKFDFYDYNAKYQFRKNGHEFSVNAYKSDNDLTNQYNSSFTSNRGDVIKNIFDQRRRWQNDAQSIRYEHQGQSAQITSVVYRSRFNYVSNTDGSSQRKIENMESLDSLNVSSQNYIEDIGVKGSVQFEKWSKLLFGAEAIWHDNALNVTNDNNNSILKTEQKGSEISAFTRATITHKFLGQFDPALRLTYVPYLNKLIGLPQLQWKKYIGNNTLLKGALGRQLQVVRSIEHESVLGTTQSYFTMSNGNMIPVGIGTNAMIGTWNAIGNFSFDVEGYYRWLDGAILHASQRPELRKPGKPSPKEQFSIYQGDAKTIGVDITASYENKHLFSLMSYTLSKSDNRFEKLFNNQYFPTSEDTRHQFKWVNTISLHTIDFSLTYIAASGRHFLDFADFKLPKDRTAINPNDYLNQLPSYQRLDVSLFKTFNFRSASAKLGVSIFNLTNRINVKYKQFVHELNVPNMPNAVAIFGNDVAQLSRTWNVSLLMQFIRQSKKIPQ
ncbi:MAG: TonB-dependent receptor plug domain-containing protein [Lewinellaceae bacterium]|nr:TonB-dependent receptor plug domain-containing protein [Lewinellaceae bacterium]